MKVKMPNPNIITAIIVPITVACVLLKLLLKLFPKFPFIVFVSCCEFIVISKTAAYYNGIFEFVKRKNINNQTNNHNNAIAANIAAICLRVTSSPR